MFSTLRMARRPSGIQVYRPGGELADEARAQHELMAHDFGIGGSFFGRVDRVLGPAHGGARVYQVRDSPMMPAVTQDPRHPQNLRRAAAFICCPIC